MKYIFVLLIFASAGIASAQKGYVAPRKSSETAVYEYRKTHDPASTPSKAAPAIKPLTTEPRRNTNSSGMGTDRRKVSADIDKPVTYDSYGLKDPNGLQSIKLNGKWGYMRWKNGMIVIPVIYDEVGVFLKGKVKVVLDGKPFYFDEDGKKAEPPAKPWVAPPVLINGRYYDTKQTASDGLSRVSIRYRFGYLDESGKEVVPLIYEDAGYFIREGMAAVKLNGHWGFIDKTGRVVIPFKYDDRYIGFSDGLAAVKLKGYWGFIDKAGKEVIPMKYKEAMDFSGGMGAVKLNGRWGFIDKKGVIVIPFQFDMVSIGFNEKGMAKVIINNEHVDIDIKDKKWSLAPASRYDEKKSPFEGLAIVRIDESYGYVDESGKEVIPLSYDNAEPFRNGFAAVGIGNKHGFIDKTGNIIIPIIYEQTSLYFSEGCAAIKLSGKWGFIDSRKKIIIPIKYENVSSFYEGLAAVKINEKWGFINKAGKLVVPARYDGADDFSDEMSAVRLLDRSGYINKTGREVVPLIYEWAYDFANGKGKVMLNGDLLYFNKEGTLLSIDKKPKRFVDPGDPIVYVNYSSQVWTADNLDVETFRDGTPIPEAKTAEEWMKAGEEGTPAWCTYNNLSLRDYGKLYNWYAVNDPRGLAPKGVHIATDAEWTALTNYLGESIDGLLLKSYNGWNGNYRGRPENVFGGYPAGYRYGNGEFREIFESGFWWTSTASTSVADSWCRQMSHLRLNMSRLYKNKGLGFSVRCVKD